MAGHLRQLNRGPRGGRPRPAGLRLGADGGARPAGKTPRRAGAGADFPAILALVQSAFAYMDGRIDPPSSMHRLTAAAVAEHARTEEVWTVESAGALAACMFLTRLPDRLYLGKLAVDRRFRGQGLARRLVAAAEARAQAHGLPLLELQTRVELTENHRAFAAMGFVETGRTAHAGFDRPTSVTMAKPVRSKSG